LNMILFFAFFTMCFWGWLVLVPHLLGFTFRQMVYALMASRYLSVKPLLHLVGITRAQFEATLVEPAFTAGIVLATTFFLMMYACNSFALGFVRRRFKRLS